MIRSVFILLFIIFTGTIDAQSTQTIYGRVTDDAANRPVGFASVEIMFSSPAIKTVADSAGNFTILVPVGRYNIRITATGYYSAIASDVVVRSGKETFITVLIKQDIKNLGEVIVKPVVDKRKALNTMATVSARTIIVEEAKNYAGGFDDPARLVTSFAGAASNTNDNGIIVRGNAPKFLQWKMEGIEIPNPNHFADLRMIGGGTLTALSSQMLGNADFFTGAFPAEYGNALSGIFDLNIKTGNNHRKEYTFQAGITGLDISSEGPLKSGDKSSYIFNYRYSTLALLAGLLPENANSIKYQDLSFKFNFPTKRTGTFSVWGIGLVDKAGAKAKMDSTKWKYKADKQDDDIKLYSGAAGFSHKYFLGNNSYVKTTLAATANNTEWKTQELDNNLLFEPKSNISNKTYNLILSSFLNKKFSAGHINKTGFLLTEMYYNLRLNKSYNNNPAPFPIVNAGGHSTVISAYSASSIHLSEKMLLNVGINGQLFTLNNHSVIEPRVGICRQLNSNHSIGLAYGLHSRLEKINYYLNNNLITSEKEVNKNLNFTKAHHIVLSYNWNIDDLFHLKAESYYQYLFSAPVIDDSSFSLLNLQNDWFFAEKLVNTGKGRNYGIDITFEKYISQGVYYLLSGSLFHSAYKGGDGIWRSTRYNRNYVLNGLIGKEWQTGKKGQNVLHLNLRCTFQGGNHYSPVNQQESEREKEIVYNESKGFSLQAQPVFNLHFTAGYRINKKRSTHEVALKILNLSAQPDFYGYQYNLINHTADKDISSVMIPNISYKIEFW